MSGLAPDFDPTIIELFARRLYGKARASVVGSTLVGAAMGGGFGAVPLTSLGEAWPIPPSFGFATLLAGIVVGSAIGYVIGDARAFGYKLQAQTALLQLRMERNTAAAAAVKPARLAVAPAPARTSAAGPVEIRHGAPAARPRPAAPEPPPSVRPPEPQPNWAPPPAAAR